MIDPDPSVSPPSFSPIFMMDPGPDAAGPCADGGAGSADAGDPSAVPDDGVVQGEVLESQDPEQAQPTKDKQAPETPIQSQIDEHNVAHAPYRPWCDCCAEAFGCEDGLYAGDGGSQRLILVIHVEYFF